MNKFFTKPVLQQATSMVCLLSTFLLTSSAALPDSFAIAANTNLKQPKQRLIQFTFPETDRMFTERNFRVVVKLAGRANADSLKVTANGKDVTRAFYTGDCDGSSLCTVPGRLNFGTELKAGWNYISASAGTKSGAAGSDRPRIYIKGDLTDPTDGAAAPYAVHVATLQTGEVSLGYKPETGMGPHVYGGDNTCSAGAGLTVVDLDRSTLELKSIKCYGPNDNTSLQSFCGTLDQTKDLIVAATSAGTPLGRLNMSPIGGTDFTNADPGYSSSIVGYGQGSQGIAMESYNKQASDPWYGVDGNLINVSADTPLYGFQSTDR